MTDTIATTRKASSAWEDIAVFGVGGWLFLCPPSLSLHTSSVDMFGSVVAGVVTASLAGIAMRKDRPWAEWTLLGWGFALAMMPFVLGFQVRAGVINAIACGVIVMAMAALRVFTLASRRRAASASSQETAAAAETSDGDVRRAA